MMDRAGRAAIVVRTRADDVRVQAVSFPLSRDFAGHHDVRARARSRGHVDGVATVRERRAEGASLRFAFDAPEAVARYVAAKGAVTLDGVSLTVNQVDNKIGGVRFGVNVIDHTAKHTTFGALAPGDHVNLEIDIVARYVARLTEGAPR